MDRGPTIELLTATHRFPCKYVFKAIGVMSDDFADRVVAVVRAELDHEFDTPYETRQTTNGRHLSVTIEPSVGSPEQVLAVYDGLKALDGLVMLF